MTVSRLSISFLPHLFFIPLFTHLLLRWNFILLELSITFLSLFLDRNRIWTVNTWIEMFQVEEKQTCQKSCSSRSPVAPFFWPDQSWLSIWKESERHLTDPRLHLKRWCEALHSKPTTIPHTLPNSNQPTFQAVPLGLIQDENDERSSERERKKMREVPRERERKKMLTLLLPTV